MRASRRPPTIAGSRSGTCASCRPTQSCAWTPRRCGRSWARTRSRAPAVSWPTRARRTRARSTRSTRSPTCAPTSLWMHVDGAYGRLFQLTERGRAAFRGIERGDSVTLDPHKGLFLPFGTGGLLVRDRHPARGALRGRPYLQDLPPTGELPNYSDSPPSSRATGAGSACGSRCGCTGWRRSARRSTRSSTSRCGRRGARGRPERRGVLAAAAEHCRVPPCG